MTYQYRRGGGYGGPPQGQATISFGGPLTPVVKYFMIANLAVFVLMAFFKDPRSFENIFGLVPYALWHKGTIWQLVSFNFLHGSLGHIAMNMLAMYFFACKLETLFGRRRFIVFLAISGVGAGLSMALFNPSMTVPTIGASGIVYGVLLAFGVTYPNQTILIGMVFPVKAKVLVMIFGGIALLYSATGSSDGVAHLAHLGGMVFGGIYLYYDRIYMQIRQRYYKRKLEHLKSKFTVVENKKDDDEPPTYH